MGACPACQTMLTHPNAAHRDITGTDCGGLPIHPVCTWCGVPVGLNDKHRAGMHTRDGEQCGGVNRPVTTAELFAARPENHEHEEEAA